MKGIKFCPRCGSTDVSEGEFVPVGKEKGNVCNACGNKGIFSIAKNLKELAKIQKGINDEE